MFDYCLHNSLIFLHIIIIDMIPYLINTKDIEYDNIQTFLSLDYYFFKNDLKKQLRSHH